MPGSDLACWRRSRENSTKRSAISRARWNCSPRLRAISNWAEALAQAGHFPEARKAYQQALQISPDFVDAQRALDALQAQKK